MNQSVSKAGFFPRLGAYLIDSIILGIIISCLRMLVGIMEWIFPDFFLFQNILFHFDIFDILFYLLTVAYFVIFTCLTGTTIGKRLFNLAVVDKEGNKITFWNALYRETVGKYLSSFFYFGYIMIFVDKDNRAFHDYLCDSLVIYTCKFRIVEKVEKVYVSPSRKVNATAADDVSDSANSGLESIYVERSTPQSSKEALEVEKAERVEDVSTPQVSEKL